MMTLPERVVLRCGDGRSPDGYGHRLMEQTRLQAPARPRARPAAVALLIGGITLVGVVKATLASWIVQRVAEEDSANEAVTRAQIEELRQEIQRLAKSLIDDREPAYGEGREGF